MSGERIDFGIERQRHEGFVGRAALLDRLDQLLATDRTDRWVVVTGGPGMGKSAMLAAWLARREATGAMVPHHFIRRGEYDWDDPAKLVSSLVAQMEGRFPDQREPDADAQKPPAARFAAMLARVSAKELLPLGERMVVLIDGLDEYEPPSGALTGDPLAAFLPHALPRGVSFLCASRPRHPYLAMLEARDGELVRLDLDDPDFAADNRATVRGFWEQAAPPLGLDAHVVDEAIARADGNLQHAVTLRKHLAGLPASQRRVEGIPRGLAALLVKLWERIATDSVTVGGLGILCAAHEALTLDELGAVAGWTGVAQRQAFVRGARELLVETRRADHQPEYRLHHDAIREHITSMVGAAEIRGHHAALVRQLATWPLPANPTTRRYALRHALSHRAEADDWIAAWRLAADMEFLEVKCRELGVHETEADIARAAQRCRVSGDKMLWQRLCDLARALARESHWLRDAPEAAAALVWNRLRSYGWSIGDLDEQLQMPAGQSFLRIQHRTTRESPALVRDFVGHTDWVEACAVTPDGRRVISASKDRTLKIWDLHTGRVLATFEGHTDRVTACAVTPDGRHVVSASADCTLKIWELHTGRALHTLHGHASEVTLCTVTPDGNRVVSASKDRMFKVWDLHTGRILAMLMGQTGWWMGCAITPDSRHAISASAEETLSIWELDSGRILATFEGHAGRVDACAVTADGRRVVSASRDETLKIWDLDSARLVTTFDGAGWVTTCAMTPDSRRAVSASLDGMLKLWDLDNGRILATFEGHTDWVTACAVTPDGRHVVSASRDATLKLWDLDSGRVLASFEGHTDWVTACTATPEGQRVVSASRDRTLKVWNCDSGRVSATFEGHTGTVTACAVTSDGHHVVSASRDGTLKRWALNSGHVLASFEGHTSWVTACAVTPDGQRLVSASGDRTLKAWDLDSGRSLTTFEGHADWVSGCAVVPDGQHVVSASRDKTLKVWALDSGRILATFEGHADWVAGCAVAPCGRRVVSASFDRTLKVWDLHSGRVLATLEGHNSGVHGCAVTPDGRRVISASHDQTLKVWDLQTYACVLTHRGDSAFTALTTTANTVIAGDLAGTIWFLDWPPAWLLGSADVARLGGHIRPFPIGPGHTSETPNVISLASRPLTTLNKHVILFLAANPSGTTRLALDEECAAIERELRMTSGRDDFDFHSKWAVSVDEMMRHLNELQPTIIHFSGHGGGSADIHLQDEQRQKFSTHRDVRTFADASIQLQGEQRQPQQVRARALTQMISSAVPSARLVVLNACFSDAAADTLRGVVDCVVGMRGAIGDEAARSFAVGFYRALGYRRSVGNAVAQAIATLAAKQLPDEHLPVCRTRDGVSADQVILPSLDPYRS